MEIVLIFYCLGVFLSIYLMEKRRRKQVSIHNSIVNRYKAMLMELNDILDQYDKKAETK